MKNLHSLQKLKFISIPSRAKNAISGLASDFIREPNFVVRLSLRRDRTFQIYYKFGHSRIWQLSSEGDTAFYAAWVPTERVAFADVNVEIVVEE